jgi:hypothetical protein
MLKQKIRKLSDTRFQIIYRELPKFKLFVDFRPLIESLGLTEDFCLVHWQARPRGERRWGIFDGKGYRGFESYRSELPCEGMQLDERLQTTVPTAVLCYRNARLLVEGDEAIVVAADG